VTSSVDRVQQETAARFGVLAQLPAPDAKVGISRSVRDQVWPLNALRHAPEPGTSGWFIWAGGEISADPDYFVPLHVSHLEEWCPEMVPYLGLPPGWRVLLAPGYEDVWYDASLLEPDPGL
jgi:hypothetical protein